MRGTRRAALTAAICLPVAGGFEAPTAAASLDADLLAACAAYQGIMQEIRAEEALPGQAFGSVESMRRERKISDLCTQMDEALRAIADIPAATPAGIAAKGALVLAFLPKACGDFELDEDSSEILVVLSLARDAAALQGRPA